MNAVAREHVAGTASGVNNAVSRVAGLLAIAVFGSVMAWAFGASLDRRLASSTAPPGVIRLVESQRDKLAGIELPAEISVDVAASLKRTVDASFVAGFRWVMLLSAGLALLSGISAWRMIGGKQPVRVGDSSAGPT